LKAANGGAVGVLRPPLGPPGPAPARTRPAEPRPDLIIDLGSRIGSRQWFRGLAVCAALCIAAFLLGPALEPLPGASAAPLPDAHWQEARALAIAPLAFGADSGRRLAPGEAVEPLLGAPERPRVDLTLRIGAGDGFASALVRAGVGAGEAQRVAALVAQETDLGEIKPGTLVELTLGRRATQLEARPLEALRLHARLDLDLSLKRVGDAYVVRLTRVPVDYTPLRIEGQVGAGLQASLLAAGVPAHAAHDYARIIAGHLATRRLDAGDRFDIIVDQQRAGTGETRTGQILYAGLYRASGERLQLMPWSIGASTFWFDSSGVVRRSGRLLPPVSGTVSSRFGLRRHPIFGFARMHRGVDIKAPHGTPVHAAADGRVVSAGWAGGYGKQVRLLHGEGLASSYSHMSKVVRAAGEFVRKGQVIGFVGSTGFSTGNHLHFEVHDKGVAIDPLSSGFAATSRLGGSDLEAFRESMRVLLTVPARDASADGPAALESSSPGQL
jgi:murein DD-endopeptidase MepM/ murein hydrolase activator NlpD